MTIDDFYLTFRRLIFIFLNLRLSSVIIALIIICDIFFIVELTYADALPVRAEYEDIIISA